MSRLVLRKDLTSDDSDSSGDDDAPKKKVEEGERTEEQPSPDNETTKAKTTSNEAECTRSQHHEEPQSHDRNAEEEDNGTNASAMTRSFAASNEEDTDGNTNNQPTTASGSQKQSKTMQDDGRSSALSEEASEEEEEFTLARAEEEHEHSNIQSDNKKHNDDADSEFQRGVSQSAQSTAATTTHSLHDDLYSQARQRREEQERRHRANMYQKRHLKRLEEESWYLSKDETVSIADAEDRREREFAAARVAHALRFDPTDMEARCLRPVIRRRLATEQVDRLTARLFTAGSKKTVSEKRERMKEESELKACTFAPKINEEVDEDTPKKEKIEKTTSRLAKPRSRRETEKLANDVRERKIQAAIADHLKANPTFAKRCKADPGLLDRYRKQVESWV